MLQKAIGLFADRRYAAVDRRYAAVGIEAVSIAIASDCAEDAGFRFVGRCSTSCRVNPGTTVGAECRVARLVWAIGLCDHSDEGIGEFLGGCVPFVGAEEATQFQAGGTVRAGQEYGAVALGVLFAEH